MLLEAQIGQDILSCPESILELEICRLFGGIFRPGVYGVLACDVDS